MTSLGVDLILEPSTHDLRVRDGDLVLGKSVAQAIKINLLFFRGEWFEDRGIGIPYFELVFRKGIKSELLYPIFHDALRTTPGVLKVNSLELELDSANRRLHVTWSVDSDEGDISGEEFFP
jgi:hypothetical protein